jgi:small subunit ribosomal protein S13
MSIHSSGQREYQYIMRIAGTDLDGTLKINQALTKIHGVGVTLANAILYKAGINPNTRTGYITETEKQRIEDVVNNPTKHGIPAYQLNRQKDPESGQNEHLTGADLTLQIKTDIEQMKNQKSWRGFRHAYGLRTRGQHTRTTGRKGKAMGVKKKEAAAKARREAPA